MARRIKEYATININVEPSEVEQYRESLELGDKIYFNGEAWIITELDEDGFEAEDDYETKYFFFDQLQRGWKLSNDIKERVGIDYTRWY